MAPPPTPTGTLSSNASSGSGYKTTVAGNAQANARIEIRDSLGNLLGETNASAFGRYNVTLATPLINGEKVQVFAINSDGEISIPLTVAAPDYLPPDTPSNLFISPDGDILGGSSEPFSKVEVRDPQGNLLGSTTVDQSGQFVINLSPVQRNGEELRVTAIDPSEKSSDYAVVFAPDSTPCFTAGTLIRTKDGLRAVETLSIGDLVMTKDHGAQPLRWIGTRKLNAAVLAANPLLQPIRIRAGALGDQTPSQDLIVSPQHRVLVRSRIAARLFGTDEVLAAAKQLTTLDGIKVAHDLTEVTYVHILFGQHEIVESNGAETESLYTGAEAMRSVGAAAREEIFAIFPQLRDTEDAPPAARRMLSGREARKLVQRHAQNNRDLVI